MRIRVLICGLLLLPLTGCGQKGPLYLPGSPPATGSLAAPAAVPGSRPKSDQISEPAKSKSVLTTPSS